MATQELPVASGMGGNPQIWIRFDDVTLVVDRLRWSSTGGSREYDVIATNHLGEVTRIAIPAAANGMRALSPTALRMKRTVDAESGEVDFAIDGQVQLSTVAGTQAQRT